MSQCEIRREFWGFKVIEEENVTGGVVVKFCQGKELYPFSRVVGAKDAEISFEFLIGSLSLSIHLRMVSCGEANIILEETSEFFSEGGGELRASVGDESIM